MCGKDTQDGSFDKLDFEEALARGIVCCGAKKTPVGRRPRID
jgi:hypothetical protein